MRAAHARTGLMEPTGGDAAGSGRERRSGRWVADPGFGVYVHIPFCVQRCHYCDFNTYSGQEHLHRGYVDALIREIERWRGPTRPATSVFFGGGTPTILDAPSLGRILDAVRNRVGTAAGAEITIEANPESVDAGKVAALLEAGFNRVSIGVQSLAPHVLEHLGRTHSPDRALRALGDARRAGCEDLNADLIYGSPWEREEDWDRSLERLVDVGPDHVSAYALTIEEGTPLASLIATGRQPDVDPDVQAERYARAQESLRACGYERYEVSNWARPGRASRHNVLYWCAGDYLGFGAGAHSHVSGRRWWSLRLPRKFVEAVAEEGSTEAGSESLGADARAGDALMLGLRLASGVDVAGFEARFGTRALAVRAPILKGLEDEGLVSVSGGWLRLTEQGTYLADEVVRRLI